MRPYQVEHRLSTELAKSHRLLIKTRTVGSTLLRGVFGDSFFQRIVHISVLDGRWEDHSLETIARMPHLQSLLISSRTFKDEDLHQLSRCQSLRALVLDSTMVTHAGVEQLRSVKPDLWCHRSQRLVIRDLRQWMQLTTTKLAVPEEFQQWLPTEYFQRVISAKVSGHNVHNAWLRKLQNIDTLQQLIFFRTNIADNQLVHLARLPNLRRLWLDGASITDGGIAHLKSLVNLEKLELQSTNITSLGIRQLDQMRKLRTLNVGRTSVGDEALQAMTKMERLEELQLFGTKVTDKGLQYLQGLPNLRTLYLDGTSVTKGAVRLLRQALPNVNISF